MTRRGRAGRVTYKVTAAMVTAMVTVLIAGAAVTGCSTAGTNDKVTTPPPTGPDPAESPAHGIDSQARADLQRLTVVDRRPYVPGY